MFSKLQLYLLTGCVLATVLVCGVLVFRADAPPRGVPIADQSAAPQQEIDSTPADPLPPHGTLKPYPTQHSPSVITNGNEADEKSIDTAMEKLAHSFEAGDGSAVADLMYTPILEKLGGREKVSEVLDALRAEMKEQKISLSWSVKKPYTYVAGASRKYAIVPYEAEIKSSGKTIKQASYEFGIKTDSGWQFVGGDQLSGALFDQCFPDFPKDIELPEMQQVSE